MATRINETQWPKQYPHENRSPKKVLFSFIHFRKGANNFVSATVKEIQAITIDSRNACTMLKILSKHGQHPEEQWATGRSMYLLSRVIVFVFIINTDWLIDNQNYSFRFCFLNFGPSFYYSRDFQEIWRVGKTGGHICI